MYSCLEGRLSICPKLKLPNKQSTHAHSPSPADTPINVLENVVFAVFCCKLKRQCCVMTL